MSSALDFRSTVSFLRQEWRFLSFGALVAFWSSPGQTFVIALFGGQLRAEFGLSHGAFGGIYTLATLTSAALLLPAGRLIDRLPLDRFTRWVVLGMAGATAAFSLVAGSVSLFFGFLGLRFAGQGLMTHIAFTSMARRYRRERGRALAVAGIGFAIGEASLPPLVVWALAVFEWRLIWLVFAVAVALTLLPLLPTLLRRTEAQDGAGAAALAERDADVRHWTRGEMLRDPRFHLLAPLVMSQSAIVTGLFFHQVHLVALKGWSLAWWSLCFFFFALASVAANIGGGLLIDRFSGRALAPLVLLPLALALLLFGLASVPITAAAVLILIGIGAGANSGVLSALWAELYGTDHLGAIRAVAAVLMVFASALGPVAMGLALDRGASVAAISYASLGFVLFAALAAVYALHGRLPATDAGV